MDPPLLESENEKMVPNSSSIHNSEEINAWNERDVLVFIHSIGLLDYISFDGLMNGRQLAALTLTDCENAVLRGSESKGDSIDSKETGRRLFEAIQNLKNGSKNISNIYPTRNLDSSHEISVIRRGEYALLVDTEEDTAASFEGEFPPLITKPTKEVYIIFLVVTLILLVLLLLVPNFVSISDVGKFRIDVLKYASIPVSMVPFTYFHIWLALWMTFYPVNFTGCWQIPGTNIGFPIGWQGIVPFKSAKMSKMAVEMITSKLVSVREVFETLDGDKCAEVLGPVIAKKMESVLGKVAMEEMPKVWSMLPSAVKQAVCSQATKESPAVVKGLLEDLGEDIEKYFDLEKLVVDVLVNNMEMCNDIFISISHRELAVIRNAGAWMGGIFGIIQMILWIFWHDWWVLPVLGFVVGACTNWIALLVIFRPINPVKICGFTLHGVFLRRQADVSACYGKLIAGKVMTAEHLNEELLCGKHKDLVLALAHKRISLAFDKSVAPLKQGPLSLAIPSSAEDALNNMKKKIADEITNDLYTLMRELEPYMTEAMDLENLLRTRMSALPFEEFEGLLHPIFQEDEPKLVLVGGVLGALLGFLQIRMF